MDITNIIPSVNISSANSLQSAVNVAVLGKALDTAQVQGQAMEDMLEAAVVVSDHILDTYA